MFTTEYLHYRDLVVYQQAKHLVIVVYDLLKKFPVEERFALCDQLRRACVSIPSNIAEGHGRFSLKEQLHYIEISFGSLNETMCQMEIACDLDYIDENDLRHIENEVVNLQKLLSGYRNSILKRLG